MRNTSCLPSAMLLHVAKSDGSSGIRIKSKASAIEMGVFATVSGSRSCPVNAKSTGSRPT